MISASLRYISLEPLLDRVDLTWFEVGKIGWVIIGSCTGTKSDMEALIQRNPALKLMHFGNKWTAQPRIEWVQEIVQTCDKAGISVFLKDNLAPLFGNMRPESGLAWGLTKDCGYYCDISVGHIDHQLRQEMPE